MVAIAEVHNQLDILILDEVGAETEKWIKIVIKNENDACFANFAT